MALNFEDVMKLWAEPVPEGDAALAKFGRAYSDPLSINGVSVPLSALVERARAAQRTFADLRATILRQVDTESHTIVVFRMGGRHVGPWATPLGEIAPTGKVIERQIIDVLGLRDGLIHEVWMVGDELGALLQTGALRLS